MANSCGRRRYRITRFFKMPPPDFYHRPMLHLDCRGRTEVEGCRAVLEYNAQQIRLDLGSHLVTLYGDELILEALGKNALQIRGQILRAELSIP